MVWVKLGLGTIGLGLVGVLGGMTPGLAFDSQLTKAQVYKLENRVQLLPYNQTPRAAQVQDVVIPRDAIATGIKSRAELLFNEGTLARIGEKSLFRFIPGMRRFQLQSGAIQAETIFELKEGEVLLTTVPDSSETLTRTPVGQVETLGQMSSQFIVQHRRSQSTTHVYALSDGQIKVSNPEGTRFAFLQAGEMVTLTSDAISPVRRLNRLELELATELATSVSPSLTTLAMELGTAQGEMEGLAELSLPTGLRTPQFHEQPVESVPEPTGIWGLIGIGVLFGVGRKRSSN